MSVRPKKKLSVSHVNGGIYESAIVMGGNLFSKVSRGGFFIFNDYGIIDGCDRPVHDLSAAQAIIKPLQVMGRRRNGKRLGAFWREFY